MDPNEITVMPIPYRLDGYRVLVPTDPGLASLAIELSCRRNFVISGWDTDMPVVVGTINEQQLKDLKAGVSIAGDSIPALTKNEAITAYQNDLSVQSGEGVIVNEKDPAPIPEYTGPVYFPVMPTPKPTPASTLTSDKLITSVSLAPTPAQARAEVKGMFKQMFTYYTSSYQGMNCTEDLMLLVTEAMKVEYHRLRMAAE